ncbi:MAG: exo-alpha-sialidase, partial [Armatimonadia bacterium]|nr:exo-alpha-sialidase [Armatimonadia bacterium]
MKRAQLLVLLLALAGAATAQPEPDFHGVPGVVINHVPASMGNYIGSPSIAILPGGAYVASHDLFGPGPEGQTVVVHRSEDRGRSWREIARFPGFWSNLFVHGGALYCMGVSGQYRSVVLRRSVDGGHTWT